MTDSYLTWLIHLCDMTHSCVWHDSFMCVTWLFHMCDMTPSYVSRDSFICVTWLIHMCDMTRSYVWHDSLIYVTWLIHMWDMTHFLRVPWLIHMCDVPHPFVTWSIRKSVFYTLMSRNKGEKKRGKNHKGPLLHVCYFVREGIIYRYVMWHDSFICDVTDWYVTLRIRVWHDPPTYVCTSCKTRGKRKPKKHLRAH